MLPSGGETAPMMSPGRHELFEEFHAAYKHDVEETALKLLGLIDDRSRWRQLLAPVTFTLDGRQNFFRSSFALAAGDAVCRRDIGRLVAAGAEIGWTCALMVDDMLDRSSEREGHPCAHGVYGAGHTTVAVATALGCTAATAPLVRGVRAVNKVHLESLAVSLLVRGALVQAPTYARPRSTARYLRAAHGMNNSTHWAMAAPLAPFAPAELVRLVWGYADALTFMGKIANDLADYTGGSTESTSLHKDYESRRPTFPVLLLLRSPLTPLARRRIEAHFFDRRTASGLTIEDLRDQLMDHGIFEQCVDVIDRHGRVALALASATVHLEPAAATLARLMERWVEYVLRSTRERVDRLGDRPRDLNAASS